MDFINIILTSISMSVDAMTVGAIDGVREENLTKKKIFSIALCFGLFQFFMPVIGYFIGYGFKDYLIDIIPWIAFSLLTLLAIKSLFDWLKERNALPEEENSYKLSIKGVLVQGVATSIDALCIGFVYLNYSISEAMITFGIIGVTTFILSYLTTFFGSKIANKLEKWGALIAAVVFFVVGLKILFEGIL